MVWPSKLIFHLISTVHCNYVARKSKEKIESSIYSVCLRHKFANSLEKKSTKTLVCLNILFVYIGSQTICMQFTQSKRLIHCMYYLLTLDTPLIRLWCPRSKLNMDEICSLNIHLWYVDIPQKVLLKSLHAQRRSFLLLNMQFDAKIPLSMK